MATLPPAMPRVEPLDLKAFNRARSPILRLARVTALVFVFLALLWWGAHAANVHFPSVFDTPVPLPWPLTVEGLKTIVFLAYFSSFVGLWFVYFTYRIPQTHEGAPSLRALLGASAWGQLLRSPDDAGIAASQTSPTEQVVKKSQATIATVALLAASAVVELEHVSGLYADLFRGDVAPTFWQEVVLGLGALSAIAAFICFLVSVDSLDSAVNDFGGGAPGWLLARHFYLQSIQPKYIGFAALLAGAVFIVCFHSRTLASVSVGLILVVGYPHWFPRVQLDEARLPSLLSPRSATLLILPFLVEPAFLLASNVVPSTDAAPLARWLLLLLPVVAAVLWAFSTPFVNVGLSLSGEFRAVWAGLLISLTAGCAGLGLLALVTGQPLPRVNSSLVLAGVFTFPAATGLYYLAGRAFGNRSDIASLFARVKPIFSLAASVWLLGEPLDRPSAWAAGLMVAGVLLLLTGGLKSRIPRRGVMFGLSAAFAWAAGEYWIAIGGSPEASLGSSFIALASGTVLAWVATAGAALVGMRVVPRVSPTWVGSFAAHGLLSFAVAYTCFFYGILNLGLGATVLITAFWPALAIASGTAVARIQRRPIDVVPIPVLVACVLLVSASVLLGWSLLQ